MLRPARHLQSGPQRAVTASNGLVRQGRCARAVRCARSACLKAAHAGAGVQFPNTEETELSMADEHPTPEHILQVGMGFWASKALLSAVEIGVFTELGRHPEDLETELSMADEHPTPEHILQVGMGFWASKALLSAVEIGVFTELGRHPEDL